MKKIEINSYLLGVAEEERCTFADLPETENEYFFFIDSFKLVPRLTKTVLLLLLLRRRNDRSIPLVSL